MNSGRFCRSASRCQQRWYDCARGCRVWFVNSALKDTIQQLVAPVSAVVYSCEEARCGFAEDHYVAIRVELPFTLTVFEKVE